MCVLSGIVNHYLDYDSTNDRVYLSRSVSDNSQRKKEGESNQSLLT